MQQRPDIAPPPSAGHVRRIKVANDFTDLPGARFRSDGAWSGEEFRETFLEPAFAEARARGGRVFIDFDGAYGYASSFLEEAFGGLARAYPDVPDILAFFDLKANGSPFIIEDIEYYVQHAGEVQNA